MKYGFDRYYVTLEYKDKYTDSTKPEFKGLSSIIMYETLSECIKRGNEEMKTGYYKSVEYSVIPANTLDCYTITLDK